MIPINKAYAGIGSRDITPEEEEVIKEIAVKLNSRGWTCYSGNAPGSDQCFQTHARDNYVSFLPWPGFCRSEFNPAPNNTIVDQTNEAVDSVAKFHPAGDNLKGPVIKLMSRNYHQVMGYPSKNVPPVKFIVCCATPLGKEVKGGTGQAIRIANHYNVPWVSIRQPDWRSILNTILKDKTQSGIR